MKRFGVKQYARKAMENPEKEKTIGAFTLKLYPERIAIFRGGEYINELEFNAERFDSLEKFASIDSIKKNIVEFTNTLI